MMNEYYTTAFNPSGNRYVASCNVKIKDANKNGALVNGASLRTPSWFAYATASDVAWIVGNDQSVSFAVVNNDRQLSTVSFPNATDEVRETNAVQSDDVLVDRPLVVQIDPTTSKLQPVIAPWNTSVVSSPYPIRHLDQTMTSDVGNATDINDGYLYIKRSSPHHLQQLASDGTIVTHPKLSGEDATTTLVDPLRDGQIAYSAANDMWALYTHVTEDRNTHCILGDCGEGFHMHVLKRNAATRVVEIANDIALEGNSLVFEGLSPFWADINQDGVDDLVTTISGNRDGAALRVYFMQNEEGKLLSDPNDPSKDWIAESRFIGKDNRWLHQLAFGPLGPMGEMELVEIRTPHIGGQVRYYRWGGVGDPNSLNVVATKSTFTSHDIDSRNVDMAVAADLNGDGIPELVVQDQAGSNIHGLQRCGDGSIKTVWKVPVPNGRRITSNFALACDPQTNDAAILLGHIGGLLRISFSDSMRSGGEHSAGPTDIPTESPTMIDPASCSSANSRGTMYEGSFSWLYIFVIWRVVKLLRA